MNTYTVVEAPLKTNDLQMILTTFRINTYKNFSHNRLYNEHLQKTRGVGGTCLSLHTLPAAFCLLCYYFPLPEYLND